MWLICGLGNFGEQYNNTRHNVGFMVVDQFAAKFGLQFIFKPKLKGEITKISADNQEILLLKPHTYMNCSGDSLQKVLNYYKIPLSCLVVIHDDLDLALGKVRIKINGGSGGHNGIKSINSTVGSSYLRIKIGIGKPLGYDMSNYVLGQINEKEKINFTFCGKAIIENFNFLLQNNLSVFSNLVIKYIDHEMSLLQF